VGIRLKSAFAVAICITLGATSSAEAATVTVGSPLTANFVATAMGASGNVTWAQTALPAAPVSSPSDGTVVSWRNRTLGGTYRLVVIHPVGGGQFTNAGASDAYHPVNFAASPAITTSLPIKAGDLLGIETTTGNGFDAVGLAAGVSGATAIAWVPHLASGQTRSSDPLVAGNEIALQATVRFCSVPTLKGLKVGAAKQALAAANCTVGAVKKPKKKAARKKAKFVKAQSAAPGTSISDTAPIDLTLGKAPKKHKK
jgi:hypothetical protein